MSKLPNVVQRLISAAVMLPAVLVFMFLGEWWFGGLVTVLMTMSVWEWVHLARNRYRALYPFALLMLWAILLSLYLERLDLLLPTVGFLLLTSISWHVLTDHSPTPLENWLLPLGGALYVGWTSGHLLLLRNLPQGQWRLFAVLGAVWLADSGAYLVGINWGKHRMAPRLSPKKSWEGFAGGIVAALIGGPLLTGWSGLGWQYGLGLGLLISIIAPLGDLGISMVKRQIGVKDSSPLIPGHGGMLDRVDSLLFAAVIGYYYNVWVMGATP